MYLPAIALIQSQNGLITSRQLSRAGLDPNDVRRLLKTEHLLRLRRGVYVDRAAWESLEPYREQPILRMRAARLSLASRDYALSHDSAAIVLGMGAPDPIWEMEAADHEGGAAPPNAAVPAGKATGGRSPMSSSQTSR